MKFSLKPPSVKSNPTKEDLEQTCINAIVACTDFFDSSCIRITEQGVFLRYGDRIFKFEIDVELKGEDHNPAGQLFG